MFRRGAPSGRPWGPRARLAPAGAVVGRSGPADRLHGALPYLFAILALVGSLLTAVTLPPFMGPDEVAHAHRANLLTLGRVAGYRVTVDGEAHPGGPTSQPLVRTERIFQPARQDPQRQVNLEDFEQARDLRWGPQVFDTIYPNTAIYSPVLYLPQTAVFAVGRALERPVLETITTARIAGALACVLVGFVALRLAGRIRWGLFAVLMLPMPVFLFGTLGQDGLTLTATALGVAVLSRGIGQARPLTGRELAVAAAAFALAGLAKAPYAAFALVLLAAPAARPRMRVVATVAVLAVALSWHAWMGLTVGPPLDSSAQREALLARPWLIGPLAVNSLAHNGGAYFTQAVGVLGWLDTPLPSAFYWAAGPVLLAAALLSTGWSRAADWRFTPAAALSAAGLAAGAVFLALYLIWTPVGGSVVEGVQGRYLLPIVLVGLLALEGQRPLISVQGGWGGRFETLAAAAVIALPVWGLIAAQQAIILRYYLD